MPQSEAVFNSEGRAYHVSAAIGLRPHFPSSQTPYFLRPSRATSMRIIATSMSVSLVCTVRSKSLLIRRFRESQPNVRSRTQP